MSLVSITFILFVVAILIVYYLVPARRQWVVLLISSLLFYFLASTPYTIIYVVLSVISVYFATDRIEKIGMQIEAADCKETKDKLLKTKKRIYLCGVIVCVGLLAALKYTNFVLNNVNMISGLFGKETTLQVHWISSLGISFYTLQMVGYLTDVYWDMSKAQKNIGKLALFNCYFPQMISGPISRYHELEDTLFGMHKFDAGRVYQGMLRILIGFFKKLVIAEHLISVTDSILLNTMEYGGVFIWIGITLYVIQIYADFSGCMDIIMGVSECFGVILPENFKTPFSSTTIQEFWQRWHITLGAWLKDYIMYPILRSALWSKYAKFVKQKWGKRAAKMIPTFTGMLILWFGMGLWHGGGWNYIGEGIWFWLVIVLGQVLEPKFKVILQTLKINVEGKAWYCFRCMRTTFIYAVGALFFKAGSLSAAIYMLKDAFSPIRILHTAKEIVPAIVMVDQNIGTMRFVCIVFSVTLGMVMMVVWGIMEKEGHSFRTWMADKGYIFNCVVVYILLFAVLIFGAYGPGYSSSEFIYGGF